MLLSYQSKQFRIYALPFVYFYFNEHTESGCNCLFIFGMKHQRPRSASRVLTATAADHWNDILL